MNRKDAKRNLPFIIAFAEGKAIQRKMGGGWGDIETPNFTGAEGDYRIKPEPQVFYQVLRSNGEKADVGPFTDEQAAIDYCKRQDVIGLYAPYTLKRFVEDLDYKSAS